MNLKINDTAKLTGVTVRTLHYYDEVGLLKPSIVTDSGYRLYDEQNLEMLQQILFFRELDFSLNQIKEIIFDSSFDKTKALEEHKILLLQKQKRLKKLVKLIDNTLKGESEMSFKEFDMSEIEETKEKYAEEVKKRWGSTDAYKESEKRTSSYTKEQWSDIDAKTKEIFGGFAEMKKENAAPDSTQAQDMVKRWQDCISTHFYPCTNEILQGLGSMYIADERFKNNLDKFGEGTAQFMAEAIDSYCRK